MSGAPADGLPPRFDAAHYLAANPDLALTADEAADHYRQIGRAEGRVASPLALRENLIGLIDDGRPVLEIGPFCDPLLRGDHVAYLDILSADELRTRAAEIGRDPAGCPARIDYVGGLDQVGRRFDAVVSSHAIEHQPDLVDHLRQVERILTPDGLFCLIIPDKRYCFDHFVAESTIAGVLQAHHERRRTHSLASVVEHVALTTHNDHHRHWRGDHGAAVPADQSDRLRRALADYGASDGSYIDVHAWFFTPDSFAGIVRALGALELIDLELAGVYDSVFDRNEFCAVLRPGAAARAHARRLAGPGQLMATPDQAAAPVASQTPDDRWLARLAHREARQLPLVEAPSPLPDRKLAIRIGEAWTRAGGRASVPAFQQDFAEALARADHDTVAADLARLGASPVSQGFFGGARQHARARSRPFADRLARWTYDKLLSLAEAVGVMGLENPEGGQWGQNGQRDPALLFRAVEQALGADLTPPAHVGGHLGIEVGEGLVLHMRMLDSIHAAWRLRQLAQSLGYGVHARLAEIGGGAGLTAFYALRLGMRSYRLFDAPAMSAVQAYVLGGAGHDMALYGEPDRPIAVLPGTSFAAAEPGSIDLLFNADSLPAIQRSVAVACLANASRLGIRHFLSINQEAKLPGETPMAELISEAGGYRLAARHRHWLRAGYVEEVYVAGSDALIDVG